MASQATWACECGVMNYMGDRTCHQCSGNREDCWDEEDKASMRYDRYAKAWHAGPPRRPSRDE